MEEWRNEGESEDEGEGEGEGLESSMRRIRNVYPPFLARSDIHETDAMKLLFHSAVDVAGNLVQSPTDSYI